MVEEEIKQKPPRSRFTVTIAGLFLMLMPLVLYYLYSSRIISNLVGVGQRILYENGNFTMMDSCSDEMQNLTSYRSAAT